MNSTQKLQNQEIVREYVNAVWNQQTNSADPYATDPLENEFRAALPDLYMHSAALVADEDRVVQRYIMTGTHTGAPLFGIPASGREMKISGITIFRLENGQVAEHRTIRDTLMLEPAIMNEALVRAFTERI